MVAFQAKGSRAMARPTPWVSPSCCHTRLNFGTSFADEVFQDAIQQVLSGIHGVHNVSDDIISFGRDQVAHDRAFRAVFERLRSKILTLNAKECEFNKPCIELCGYVFSRNGVSPDRTFSWCDYTTVPDSSLIIPILPTLLERLPN